VISFRDSILAIVTADVAATLDDLGFAGRCRGIALSSFSVYIDDDFLRSAPRGNLPHNASEALDAETFLLPFPTRFSRSIQRTKSSIDCSLIGFWTKLMTSYRGRSGPWPGSFVRTKCAVPVGNRSAMLYPTHCR